MRILITNDDGVEAPGIAALAAAAARAGHDVVVAAPPKEASGSSAAITSVEERGRVVVERRSLPGLPDVTAYAVAGSPGFIAILGLGGGFGPGPDVVLSGVNRGANAGHAVLHSGTVGAAITAAQAGPCRAMAVSLDVLAAAGATVASGGAAAAPDAAPDGGPDGGPDRGRVDVTEAHDAAVAGGPSVADAARRGAAATAVDERVRAAERADAGRHWDTAAGLAVSFLDRLLAAPQGTVLNLNVPDVPADRLPPVRRATLAPFGQVQMTVAEVGQGFVRLALADTRDRPGPDTDVILLGQGNPTLTPIRGVCEATDVHIEL
jgi:5'-nucleotidase